MIDAAEANTMIWMRKHYPEVAQRYDKGEIDFLPAYIECLRIGNRPASLKPL